MLEELIKKEKLDKAKEEEEREWNEQAKISSLSKSITLEQVKRVCEEYLYLPDNNIVDFVLAVYMSNFNAGERLWTWLIGPPSVGKTEMLRALFSEASILKDSLTAKTLFSGLRIGGKDPSLFKRINLKVLIIKDFTKILSGDPNSLSEILGQLRCAYDGYYDASTGAEDKDYHYETNFTLIAGVTPAIDDHYSISRDLGERFITWRITNIDRKKLCAKVKENENKTGEMRGELKSYFGAFIKKYRILNKQPVLDDLISTNIGNVADLATWIRTTVTRFGYTREVRRMPEKEGSARLYKQLLHLAKSLALVRDKEKVTESEYAILYKVALDSIPPERVKVIELLLELTGIAKNENFLDSEFWFETPEISDHMNLPTSTTRIILDDLFLLKILERKGANPLLWHLNSEFASTWVKIKPL